MNKFELFSMIFYALDHQWKIYKNDVIGDFLSDANPFLFSDIGSADPCIYIDFCNIVSEDITINNSYDIALEYVVHLNSVEIFDAFSNVSKKEWNEALEKYMSQPHKK